MAIAQSVCEDYHTAEECRLNTAQPRSAILQFNRRTRLFGEMLPRTDAENVRLRGAPVPGRQLSDGAYAFRLDAGRAVGWDYVELLGRPLLAAASLSHGVILYEFSFQTITSLFGAIGLTSDTRNERVFVLHGATASVTALYRGPSFDKTGMQRKNCPRSSCLGYSRTISSPLRGAMGFSWRNASGHFGVGWIGRGGAGDWGEWGVDYLAVVGGTPRDEVLHR
jgi:hypothetical protein